MNEMAQNWDAYEAFRDTVQRIARDKIEPLAAEPPA